jgi:hypothetical protein
MTKIHSFYDLLLVVSLLTPRTLAKCPVTSVCAIAHTGPSIGREVVHENSKSLSQQQRKSFKADSQPSHPHSDTLRYREAFKHSRAVLDRCHRYCATGK